MIGLIIAAAISGPMYLNRVVDRPMYVKASSAPYIPTLKFDAPATHNGLSNTWDVTGVPAPDWVYRVDSPTHTWLTSGVVSTVKTGVCPDGDYSDVSTDCLESTRLGGYGANGGLYINTGEVDWDGDVSLVAVFNQLPDAGDPYGTLYSQRPLTSAGNVNFLSFKNINSGCELQFDNSVDATVYTRSPGRSITSGWAVCGASLDFDGTIRTYTNGVGGTAQTHPGNGGATFVPYTQGWIGRNAAAGSAYNRGDILAIYGWNGTVLTDAQQAKIFSHIAGIDEAENDALPTFASTGVRGYYVDGLIETYSENFPAIGVSIPTGMTGGGTPTDGHYAHSPVVENVILYSRDLSTGWTEAGTGVINASTGGLFRDGRAMYSVKDDSGSVNEYIYQTISGLSMSVGDKFQIVMDLKAVSGTAYDVAAQEASCGGLPPSLNTFPYRTSPAVWTRVSEEYTWQDATCTGLTIYFYPHRNTGVAPTGEVEVVFSGFADIGTVPGVYCETGAAANSCGGDLLSYGVEGVLVTSGAFPATTTTTTIDVTMSEPETAAGDVLWQYDDGSASNYESIVFNGASGATLNHDGAFGSYGLTGITWTPGTDKTIYTKSDYVTPQYQLQIDATGITCALCTTTAPTGITTLRFGSDHAGAASPGQLVLYKNLQVTQ